MAPKDISEGLRLCRLNGWNQLEDDWRCFLELDGGEGWLAEHEDAVVGTVAVLRYGRKFSWLSMMLVDQQQRRSGIGSHLMETALAALNGEACIRLDATPAGEPLYRRFGFSPECELVRAKVTSPIEHPITISERTRPLQPDDFDDVFRRDKQVFGADRSGVLRSFHRRAPKLAWIIRDKGRVAGYCFGRPGHLYGHVGPVIAEDLETARALVSRCIPRQAESGLALDTPLSNPEWLAWLKSAGFVIERPFVRMHLGNDPAPRVPDALFGIGGPEFG